MRVEREQLERLIAEVRRTARDPRAGIYGPGSVSWKVDREVIVMLGGGRAALLQLAHPYVAHAIDQHSHTKSDPIGRFQRTFANVFAIVFGDLDHAIESARRVYEIHARVQGEIREDIGPFSRGHVYAATDVDALFWVQATLIDSALMVYELVLGPLTRDEKERYYAESRLFAALFGIPGAAMPERYSDFERYMEEACASERMSAGAPAREIAGFLFRAAPPYGALAEWYRIFTAGLMPDRLRESFALPWGRREQAIFARSTVLLRAGYRVVPRRLRYFPDYVEAGRRVAGAPARDRLGRWLEALAIAAMGHVTRPDAVVPRSQP
jgi:uncharacterized protein (DUF2236 family)